jgi:hypothetical protein
MMEYTDSDLLAFAADMLEVCRQDQHRHKLPEKWLENNITFETIRVRAMQKNRRNELGPVAMPYEVSIVYYAQPGDATMSKNRYGRFVSREYAERVARLLREEGMNARVDYDPDHPA